MKCICSAALSFLLCIGLLPATASGASTVISQDMTIDKGSEYAIAASDVVEVQAGVTLTNNGEISIEDEGTLINSGTIINNGEMKIYGTLTNNGVILNIGTGSITGDVGGNQPVSGAVVQYLDENGDAQSQFAQVLTASDTAWGADDGQAHWYVVDGNVEIATRITVTGDVHLILKDDCHLNAQQGVQVQDNDTNVANGSLNNLTIYAQSTEESMGALTATGGNHAGIGGNTVWNGTCGAITINGGKITASSTGNASIGADAGFNALTINGGVIYAASEITSGIGAGGRDQGQITITGGNVTAIGAGDGAGIGGSRHGLGTKIVISGGYVDATATGDAAGIGAGGGRYGGGGLDYVTITGGTVIAKSSNHFKSGIGSGTSTGTVTISGGFVTAIGGNAATAGGIGCASFSTGDAGNAVIIASSTNGSLGITADSDKENWRGVIFEGDSGNVYGNVSLDQNAEIPEGKTLVIPQGITLTIKEGTTLNNGAVDLSEGGVIVGAYNGKLLYGVADVLTYIAFNGA